MSAQTCKLMSRHPDIKDGQDMPNPGTTSTAAAVRLGKIRLREAGHEVCQDGSGTTEPEWVGRYGLSYGDINLDGSLN